METHYRQGDVLIERVAEVPEGATALPRENGRVILAHGEVTGHAHALSDADTATLFETVAGEHFLRLDAPGVLRHEEHGHIPLEAGAYRVTRQVEYTPEEIRQVAD